MTKHIKDEEWLLSLKNGNCPYCNDSIKKKGQIKRTCKNCDFELYGNQEYLAYKKLVHLELFDRQECISFISSGTHNFSFHDINYIDICQHKRTKYDPHHDEMYCLDCGTLTQGPPILREAGYRVIYPEGERLHREINWTKGREVIKGIIH
jgi:hypothetical protein